MITISQSNPYLRAAAIQPAVLEGVGERIAYDHRIFYILEGDGTLVLENRPIAMSPDLLVFIPPQVGYCFCGKMRVIVLNFDMTRACNQRKTPLCPPPARFFRKELLFDQTLAEDLDQPFLMKGDPVMRETVLGIVGDFTGQFAGQTDLADAFTSASVKRLLTDLIYRRQAGDEEQKLCDRVYSYIRLHAAQIGSNDDLGQLFGYHPVYLGAVFKKKTGITLHDAIRNERVNLACKWLIQTDHSVERIAYDTGFSSRSHFCTSFRKMKGISPREYRLQYRSDNGIG